MTVQLGSLLLVAMLGLGLAFCLACLGWCSRRDVSLKENVDSRMAGLVRLLLGVYTRGA